MRMAAEEKGVERAAHKGSGWIAKAAENGGVDGQEQLALMHFRGERRGQGPCKGRAGAAPLANQHL